MQSSAKPFPADEIQAPQEIAGFFISPSPQGEGLGVRLKNKEKAIICKTTQTESITKQQNKLLKQLRHIRFTMTTTNDILSSLTCYWYEQAHRCIEPIGKVNYSDYTRPWYIHE